MEVAGMEMQIAKSQVAFDHQTFFIDVVAMRFLDGAGLHLDQQGLTLELLVNMQHAIGDAGRIYNPVGDRSAESQSARQLGGAIVDAVQYLLEQPRRRRLRIVSVFKRRKYTLPALDLRPKAVIGGKPRVYFSALFATDQSERILSRTIRIWIYWLRHNCN
jgi:hypothetical protein